MSFRGDRSGKKIFEEILFGEKISKIEYSRNGREPYLKRFQEIERILKILQTQIVNFFYKFPKQFPKRSSEQLFLVL